MCSPLGQTRIYKEMTHQICLEFRQLESGKSAAVVAAPLGGRLVSSRCVLSCLTRGEISRSVCVRVCFPRLLVFEKSKGLRTSRVDAAAGPCRSGCFFQLGCAQGSSVPDFGLGEEQDFLAPEQAGAVVGGVEEGRRQQLQKEQIGHSRGGGGARRSGQLGGQRRAGEKI